MAQSRTDESDRIRSFRTEDVPVRPGDVLAGKYRVERVLGSGGMGVVVLAVHVDLGQRVALKFLLPRALHVGETHSRFLREARAAVQIESEHVARVLDFGRLENGAPYLVMEYLDGKDLSARITGPQPIGDSVDFVLQACAAMAVAHSLGIIHRDLKPGNLFVTSRPDGSPLVKVLDFGISKLSLLEASVVLTHSSMIIGSPRYMSPEQARNAGAVDARTDIWSLGAILYELLTGVPPFQGDSLTEVLTLLVTAAPEPISRFRPDVPRGLERAVLKALEKPLERRYANIAEFSAELVEYAPRRSWALHDQVSGVLARAGISAPPGASPSLAPSSTTIVPPSPSTELDAQVTLLEPRRAPASRSSASSKTRRLTALLGASALLAASLVLLLGYRTPPSSVPAPAAALPAPRARTEETPPKAASARGAATAEPQAPSVPPAGTTSPAQDPAAPGSAALGRGAATPALRAPALPPRVTLRAIPTSTPALAPTVQESVQNPSSSWRSLPARPLGELPSVAKKPPRTLDAENPFDAEK